METNKLWGFLINNTWVKICGSLIISFLIVISVSDIFPTKQVEKDASLETFTTHLSDRISKFMECYRIPGVCISLLHEGQTVWTKAYGYADIEAGRKMTTNTYLRVQSISKSVTAWGVMRLVEQGKIELDNPIGQYIINWKFPESKFSSKHITVRQLLCHSAGMPLGDFFNYYSPHENIPSLEESLLKEATLIQEPGISFAYSNTGFNLLELLIEEVTGRDFAKYMEEEVLFPLGMHHSTYNWKDTFDPPIPFGYDLTGKAIPVYIYPEKGSGGLFATVKDIATFVIAGMPYFSQGQQVLSSQSLNKLYTPMVEELGMYSLVFNAYGLGHYIEILPNGQQAISHGGQGTGWMTHFHSVPETGDGIVILTNSQRSWPFIAYILSDWAQWSGLSSVGMEQIILGQGMIWVFIYLVWFVSFWQVWRLAAGLILKGRHFYPLSKESRFLRIIQSCLFLVLGVSLFWCINQPYFILSSIFPIASGWLRISIFTFSIVLLLSALFPLKGKGSVIRRIKIQQC